MWMIRYMRKGDLPGVVMTVLAGANSEATARQLVEASDEVEKILEVKNQNGEVWQVKRGKV